MEKVVLIGQGYVGLPLAMSAVDAGFDVVGVELDATRVKRLTVGDSYVEDVPSVWAPPKHTRIGCWRSGSWPTPYRAGAPGRG